MDIRQNYSDRNTTKIFCKLLQEQLHFRIQVNNIFGASQQAFTCSKATVETLEQCVKPV